MSLESFGGPREYPSAAVLMTEARRLEILSDLMLEQSRIALAIQSHQAYMNTSYTTREAAPAAPVRQRRKAVVEKQAADDVGEKEDDEEEFV